MTTTTYRQTTIRRTETTTDTKNGIRNLYELSGNVSKSAGTGKFLTSVAAAKRYISETLDGYTKYQPPRAGW